ncbi:translation initiation factor eIF-1/SUI1-like protein [Synechococcus sp. PCC 7502]|uniref:translation initiation factor n=1 Tax=Synechococcus sp. PCC 7502 TaxID=1173263 RepID=UPI00029FBC74|nr:translation initiation factor [Synechococcus sp. PCC 7502]AFY74988.1 translation initiation factor eIF-1/SUI1-like protein [Synechococcus sp. PCC 7502]
MSSQHRLVYQEFGNAQNIPEPDNILRSPEAQSPRIQASRKGRKGKTVTVITGLEADNTTLELLLKQLKNQCGAGGTIKDGEIEIQGDHAPKILQILTKLGYKAKISGG